VGAAGELYDYVTPGANAAFSAALRFSNDDCMAAKVEAK
jgi:hypothetical protein